MSFTYNDSLELRLIVVVSVYEVNMNKDGEKNPCGRYNNISRVPLYQIVAEFHCIKYIWDEKEKHIFKHTQRGYTGVFAHFTLQRENSTQCNSAIF